MLRIRIEGAVQVEEMIAALQRIVDDPDVAPALPNLLDVRDATMSASMKDMERVSDFMASQGDFFPRRKAVLVKSALHYGLGRMASVVEEMRGNQHQVFRDVDEALAYVRRPD